VSAAGALIGFLGATGIIVIGTRVAATRRPSIAMHVAHYVRRPGADVTHDVSGPLATWLALVAPILQRQRTSDLRLRLARAGRSSDLTAHRIEQITAIGLGSVSGLALGLLLTLRGASPAGVLMLIVLGAIAGYLVHDRKLSQSIGKRQERISQQLPTVAELLAFAVAAGESPGQALVRVSQTVTGELAAEINEAVIDMRAGTGFDQAMRDVAARCGSSDVERFIDGLIVAMERGTPIADVMRAQAADARAADRRRLMEVAGKKDVAMLIPVVFLILPVVVMVALFPGLRGIQMFIN
jgi:tight adherence protein C